MIKLFKRFFTKKTPKGASIFSNAAYKTNLINNLETDHKELLSLYHQIMANASERNFKSLHLELEAFKIKLKAHLAEEFRDLYTFVEFVVIDGNDKSSIREFRSEMNTIAIQVMSALNYYQQHSITENSVDKFIKDFEGIGGILVDRIMREETLLYPMYSKYGKER